MAQVTGRLLTVCNFVTVDGRYEDDDHDIASFFTHQHPDYRRADDFDHYATSLLRRSDVVLLSGRRSSLGNLGYWTSVLDDPDATAIRGQFAALFRDVFKVVVSDTITEADLEPYENVRIVRIADARAEVARLKAEAGAGILVLLGRAPVRRPSERCSQAAGDAYLDWIRQRPHALARGSVRTCRMTGLSSFT